MIGGGGRQANYGEKYLDLLAEDTVLPDSDEGSDTILAVVEEDDAANRVSGQSAAERNRGGRTFRQRP